MSAADLRAEALQRLGAGDEIFVSESMKELALELVAVIEDVSDKVGTGEEQTDRLLARSSDQSEAFLSLVCPTCRVREQRRSRDASALSSSRR